MFRIRFARRSSRLLAVLVGMAMLGTGRAAWACISQDMPASMPGYLCQNDYECYASTCNQTMTTSQLNGGILMSISQPAMPDDVMPHDFACHGISDQMNFINGGSQIYSEFTALIEPNDSAILPVYKLDLLLPPIFSIALDEHQQFNNISIFAYRAANSPSVSEDELPATTMGMISTVWKP